MALGPRWLVGRQRRWRHQLVGPGSGRHWRKQSVIVMGEVTRVQLTRSGSLGGRSQLAGLGKLGQMELGPGQMAEQLAAMGRQLAGMGRQLAEMERQLAEMERQLAEMGQQLAEMA